MYASLAAKWNEVPKDALDTLVLNAVDKSLLEGFQQTDYTPFSPATKMTGATLIGPDGREFDVIKGAPHVILPKCGGNKDEIESTFDHELESLALRGIRGLAVAVGYRGEHMNMIGLLTFLDPPRDDTKVVTPPKR